MTKTIPTQNGYTLKLFIVAALLLLTGVVSLAHAEGSNQTGELMSHADDGTQRLRGLVEPVKASQSYDIAVSLVHLKDDFWRGIAYGIANEAKRVGIDVIQVNVAGAYGNVRQQFAQLKSFQAKGVDAVILGAAAFRGYDPILHQLKQAGITVVAVGVPVNSKHMDFGIIQKNSPIGRMLGRVACARHEANDATAITIAGPAGAEWAHRRQQAFVQKTKACGIQIIEGPAGGSMDIGYALAQTSDMLVKYEGVDFVFTPAISLGLGAVKAVRQNHSNALVLTSAIVSEAVPMVKTGEMVTTSEPGILMGRVLVQYLVRYLDDKPMPGLEKAGSLPYSNFIIPPKLIDAKNIKDYPLHLWDLLPKDWSLGALQ